MCSCGPVSLGPLSKKSGRTLSNFIPSSLNCSNLTLVHFLSYFPCVNVSREEELKGCDIFAYVAAEMAAERINRDHEVFEKTELSLGGVGPNFRCINNQFCGKLAYK